VEKGLICEQDIGPILSSESQMTSTPRQASCMAHRQQEWTSWPDVTITKYVADRSRTDWS